MPALNERILRGIHTDEQLESYFEDNWEPQSIYSGKLGKVQLGQVVMPFDASVKGNIYVVRSKDYLTDTRGCLIDTNTKYGTTVSAAITPVISETRSADSIEVEIIRCIAARPHESIKLGSKVGIVIFLFTLIVYFVGGVLIISPVFAVFGIVACGVFWTMAMVDRRLYHRSR